jgi:hypothetical protein
VGSLERRLLLLGLGLTAGGGLLTWVCFGVREGLSFLAGAALAGGDLLWLRSTVGTIFSGSLQRSRLRVLAGFICRLLLIPLCLYAMMRFLFLDVIAAVAGFALFVCSVFVEGILEAFGSSPK